MVEESNQVALLSIKPKFADAIFSGVKQVEFRKSRLREGVKYVVVYATAPISKVIGYFRVAFVKQATPRLLWRRYWRVAGIDELSFDEYFADRRVGYAIGVESAIRLETPIAVRALTGANCGPQGYCYVSRHVLEQML